LGTNLAALLFFAKQLPMNQTRVRVAFFVWVVASTAWLAACGGRAATMLGEPAVDGALDGGAACPPAPCPSNFAWDPVTCACDVTVGQPIDAGPIGVSDATAAQCPPILCPAGSYEGVVGGVCACVPYGEPTDSGFDVTVEDVSVDVIEPLDVSYPYDVYYPVPDEGLDGPYCPPYYCGNGYTPNQYCQCVPCAATCPNGQMPGTGCNGCVACPYRCPAGFDYGPNCSCVPPGVDAGNAPPPGDGGGVTCLLEGYYHCNAGSWCELGVCPGGTTQYGCYCNADGTATCDLSCPVPPPCTIPGQGTCPYGAECVYGSCASNASGNVFVCSCYGGGPAGGSASCYTASCADGGPFIGDGGIFEDGGNGGGVTCLLGYRSCSAGSFCSLGTCPDGTTQYGCLCNADGTATCNLTCPAPPSCVIPGEGTCPYGSQCIYGTCDGGVGTQLSCYCGSAGNANCYTNSCSNVIDAGTFFGPD
jgi:hypothetical protein